MVQTLVLFSQEGNDMLDTLIVRQDTLLNDTVLTNIRKPSPNAIDKLVTYKAAGLIKRDIINKRVILVKEAVVNYGEIEIKADSIAFDMTTNLLFAIGRKDSTGKVIGSPVFKEGSQEFESKELTYNFKTRKAVVRNIITKQADGLLHSNFTKLLEDGTSNILKSTYSTCDADTPHFYINLPKAKVYPGEKIVSGPGNLVIEGIPLPLAIPFGFFPVNTKKAASGILFPQIGEERQRGYSLTDGGYYFAINSYLDLTVKGNIYSNGSWLASAQTSYNRLYKYSGNFSFNYANNINGHKGLDDYSQSTNYKVGWIYNQDAKSSPGSRFSASVNMSSSGYEKTNSYVVADHVTTQKQSSVSYSKTWEGTPFNFAASANHSQNTKNKTIRLDLPKANFNVGRIYPLKSKNSSGPTKWYQELQFQYSASFDNQINTYDSLLFTKEVWDTMDNGFKQEIPVSLQLRPFKNFSISPSMTYSAVMYSQRSHHYWDENTREVVTETTKGIFYGQAFNPSISASFNPQIFGMYSFKNTDARMQAIRHVMKPSVSFNYIPSLPGLSSDMYENVQIDTTGTRFRDYSIYEGNIYGTPSLSKKSGIVGFGLVNIIEGKMFAKNDTTGKARKIKIIDNFGINTSYNVFADSIKWSPVTMAIRTTLFNNFNLSANSSFSMYALDEKGRVYNAFLFSKSHQLLRLTNFTTSLDFSLSELLAGDKKKNKSTTSANSGADMFSQGYENTRGMSPDQSGEQNQTAVPRDEYGYQQFDVPWSMNISYSLNYSKPGLKSRITQAMTLNGNVTLTKPMAITYISGYDFTGKSITMTSVGIRRDLHCWEMNLNWIPIGSMKGWNFTIRAKASVLGDLKYERRKDYHDSY
ncbi:MAG: LPS-assembly protein LptD [Bacteroidales bacterium]|nr:LPS-assembly protein LptD [Bacteroidales bacterium]